MAATLEWCEACRLLGKERIHTALHALAMLDIPAAFACFYVYS